VVFFLVFFFFYFKKFYSLQNEKKQLELQLSQEIAKATIEIQEHLFEQLSLEIHDNVNQTLSLSKVQLSTAKGMNQSDQQIINEAKTNISDSISALRNLAKSLNGDLITQMGLIPSLLALIKHINTSGFIQVSLYESGTSFALPKGNSLLIYRMIQESLQNIINHAEATITNIYIQYDEPRISLSIIDNGKGFNYKADSFKGLGLQGLHKRAALLGGSVDIISKEKQGTTIRISI
jgi:two-component system, NarL family, sensor kinase